MQKRFLQVLNQIWAAVTIPLVFFAFVTPPTLLVIPFPVKIRLKVVGPFWRAFALYTLKYACWAQLYTEDRRQGNFKTYPPSGLYIANHQSFIDIPLALTQFQVPPIMKKEVLYLPLLGVLGWAAGSLVVSRGKRNSRKKVFIQAKKRLVEDQFAVQYYPEGTRSRSGTPKDYTELKVTLLQLAYEEKVPVIPVSMYGTSKILSDIGMISPGQKLGIITHEAIDPKDYADIKTFTRAAWEQVLKGHQELRAKLES